VREKGFCYAIFKSLKAVIDRLCSTVNTLTEDAKKGASITWRKWLDDALTI